MKLRRLIILIISVTGCLSAFSQTEIDYTHKTLIKALEKTGIADLSGMNELSWTDSTSLAQSFMGKYFQFETEHKTPYKYLYVGRVNCCRAGGCSISPSEPMDGGPEYFDYFILFDAKTTVQLVKVFNYQATHGQEITSKGWLKQFVGHDGTDPLQVDKNIDTISGATISVNAITKDVESKTELLKQLLYFVARL